MHLDQCFNFHDFRELARRRLPRPLYSHLLRLLILPLLAVSLFAQSAMRDPDGFLRQICPSSQIKQTGNVRYCAVCPDGSDPGQEPFYPVLERVRRGHFTAPSRDEALAWFRGCGGLQNPGFTALFRKAGARWQKIWVDRDLQLDICKIHFNPAAGDGLICEEGPRERGSSDIAVRSYRITESGLASGEDLYSFIDTLSSCADVTTRCEENLEFTDLNHDGTKDIRANLRVWQGTGRRDSKGICRIQEQPKTFILIFLWQAGHFQPTAETVRIRQELKDLFAADKTIF